MKKVQFTIAIANPEDPQQRRERKFELSRKHVPKIYDEAEQYWRYSEQDRENK
jgi:hypothetical protein